MTGKRKERSEKFRASEMGMPRAVLSEPPSEILLIVLNKLALQDPLSFLDVIRTCKAFHIAAAHDLSLWKTAFYAPSAAGEGVIQFPYGNACRDEIASLEAEVARLGGYKRLLVARWRNCLTSESSSSKPRASEQSPLFTPGLSSALFSPTKVTENALILVRFHGNPVAFGVHSPFNNKRRFKVLGRSFWQGKVRLPSDSVCIQLQPLIPIGELITAMNREAWRAGYNRSHEYNYLFIMGHVLSTELYALRKQSSDENGTDKLWRGRFKSHRVEVSSHCSSGRIDSTSHVGNFVFEESGFDAGRSSEAPEESRVVLNFDTTETPGWSIYLAADLDKVIGLKGRKANTSSEH